MTTIHYQERRGQLQTYFDRTAVDAWARLTSTAPVSRIRATVRAGRDRMRNTLLGYLPANLTARTLLDAGCGTGALLAQLKQNGFKLRGLEYSDAGIASCRERGLHVEKFDLESEEAIEGSWDLTVSFEVAEHLPESMADNYVRVITQFSPVVIMSAATVGQGGKDHVNEQPHEYWIAKMRRRSFDYDEETSHQVRAEWAENGVAPWYVNNAMIFRRRMAHGVDCGVSRV